MTEFKMPDLPLAKPPSAPPPMSEVIEEKKPGILDENPEEIPVEPKSTDVLKKRLVPPNIEYNEPSWSGLPPSESPYFIEELKNGTIVQEHKLIGRNYFVIGRLPNNDIQLEHPSLSRYHAVLQFKTENSTDQPVGFYLYDLGSTHGTFHNKKKCFQKTFYRLRVGHGIKVGGSTRLLILQGTKIYFAHCFLAHFHI